MVGVTGLVAIFGIGMAADAPIYAMFALLILLWAALMLLSRWRS